MKRILWISLFALTMLQAQAQMDQPAPTVFIYINGEPSAMTASSSQTELKKGWNIQGYSVGRRLRHYFWKPQAAQIADRNPKFAIYPTTQELNDYALIRLKKKKEYRLLPAATLAECNHTRVELGLFRIESLPGMGFAVTPLTPLEPGEYILVDLSREPLNPYGDFKAYDFSVRE